MCKFLKASAVTCNCPVSLSSAALTGMTQSRAEVNGVHHRSVRTRLAGRSAWLPRSSCENLLPGRSAPFCCWLLSWELHYPCLTPPAVPSSPPVSAAALELIQQNTYGSDLLSGEAKRKFDTPEQISYTAAQVLFQTTCLLACSRKTLSNMNDLFQGSSF